jgi:hypothetical protein
MTDIEEIRERVHDACYRSGCVSDERIRAGIVEEVAELIAEIIRLRELTRSA